MGVVAPPCGQGQPVWKVEGRNRPDKAIEPNPLPISASAVRARCCAGDSAEETLEMRTQGGDSARTTRVILPWATVFNRFAVGRVVGSGLRVESRKRQSVAVSLGEKALVGRRLALVG